MGNTHCVLAYSAVSDTQQKGYFAWLYTAKEYILIIYPREASVP